MIHYFRFPGLIIYGLILLTSCSQVDTLPDKSGPHAEHKAQFGERVPLQSPRKVLTGLDVLEALDFKPLIGKSVGIVTNHTARNKAGKHLVDLLHDADGITVKAIFAPEHGFRGLAEAGEHVAGDVDPSTGAPIYSLYGEDRKPSEEMLEGVDMLIFDIQDIGARFYTYISTMGYVMEAGAEYNIPVMILDRPNPISGFCDGNVLDYDFQSFVGRYPIPIQHGLTVAELARMIQGEDWVKGGLKVELHIVKVEGWEPELFWNQTDLTWIDPSPNMRNLNEALTYPGLCLLEGTNVSEGRGTEKPFEWIGAPWINGKKLAKQLLKTGLEGFTVEPVTYVPEDMPGYSMNPKYEGKEVHGVHIRVTEPAKFKPVAFGVHLLSILKRLYPDKFQWRSEASIDRLWGDSRLREMIDDGYHAEEIIETYQPALRHYNQTKIKYLIYDR